MRKIKSLNILGSIAISSIVSLTSLATISCSNEKSKPSLNESEQNVRFATFNVSFATDNNPNERYQQWYDFLHLNHEQQETLISKWKESNNGIVSESLTQEEKELTERIMQIRNIAAIIQKQRPAILSLNEFNNDGYGNNEIIELFQKNYLSYGQSLNGYRGGDIQEPIHYPFYKSFATNTGLISGMDLDNDGVIATDSSQSPNDAYGFGYYHGHYAIGIMSQYELDIKNARTFQNFKYSDMRDFNDEKLDISSVKVVKDSTVKKFDEQGNQINEIWKAGDNWYTEKEWQNIRLSSKNHIDLPVIINGKTIHLLLSHPTPSSFNQINGVHTNVTTERNKYEVLFWKKYINNAEWIYDDNGKYGGIDGTKEKFVILGDLNADPRESTNTDEALNDPDAYKYGIRALVSDDLINQEIITGTKIPISKGAFDAYNENATGDWKISNRFNHSKIEAITSTFGLTADWVIPDKKLDVVDSGVFWVGQDELGHYLFIDKYGEKVVKTKEVSSDHRMVWIDLKI